MLTASGEGAYKLFSKYLRTVKTVYFYKMMQWMVAFSQTTASRFIFRKHREKQKVKSDKKNKPKGLKVAKEDQSSIGLMVNGLDG